jgi:LysR family hydrogen peroxide-inducible transcriptional activator
MTLTELRYILALHQHQHFAKAAQACHVTQSTLSAGLKHLEDNLGVILVERNRQFLRFTPLGEAFVPFAQEIISRADDLVRMTKTHDPLTGELNLGVIYTIAPYLLPNLIKPWRQTLATVPLRLVEGFTHELIAKLNDGDLDAIIIALPYQGLDNFNVWQLYREGFTLVLPENHPLAIHQRLSLSHLEQEHMMILGQGHCFRDHALSAFPKQQPHPAQLLIEGSSLETLRAMVASGIGISLLPDLSAQQPWPGLITRPLADKPTPYRDVVLVARSSHPRQEIFRRLSKTIQQLMNPNLG